MFVSRRNPAESAEVGDVPEAVEPSAIRAHIIVASTRAAHGLRADATGGLLRTFLTDLGLNTEKPVVVPDGQPVGEAIAAAIAQGARIVLTTGGTGLTPSDQTPQVTRPFLDEEIPGIPEALRAAGLARGIPTALLSRGLAGLAGRTLIVNLPGSAGAVLDAIEVLRPILLHALEQMDGGDH